MTVSTVLLFTDRPGFEPIWRPQLEQHGLEAKTLHPSALSKIARGSAVVLDADSTAYADDDLISAVGFACAAGATVAVRLPNAEPVVLEEVLEEMCPSLVARGDTEAPRVAALMARRLDVGRSMRFEFVTLSPRGDELVAILGDGRAELLARPVNGNDDGSAIESLELSEQARTATMTLENGTVIELSAADVAKARNAGGNGEIGLDGAKLGQRIRELRKEAGLTQAELARRTGIHRPNIARVEAGRHTPSLETIARLATAIGVPTTRVISED